MNKQNAGFMIIDLHNITKHNPRHLSDKPTTKPTNYDSKIYGTHCVSSLCASSS